MFRPLFSALNIATILAFSTVGFDAAEANFAPHSSRSRISAGSIDDCDGLFEERANLTKAKAAAGCYAQYLRGAEGDRNTRLAAFTNAFASWHWIARKSSVLGEQRMAVDEALGLTESAAHEFPNFGLANYWGAEFLLIGCQLEETSTGISLCLISTQFRILRDLEFAGQTNAAIEGYGPLRTRGMLLRETTPLLARDRRTSEALLRQALEQAPYDSRNHLEYARTLLALGDPNGARGILQPFVTKDCLTMNPRRLIECQDDQRTARGLLNLGY